MDEFDKASELLLALLGQVLQYLRNREETHWNEDTHRNHLLSKPAETAGLLHYFTPQKYN